LGVLAQKVPENHDQLAGTIVVAARSGGANVIANHVSDPMRALGLLEEVPADRRGGDVGDMLMFPRCGSKASSPQENV
jgi:hypothetical protein